MVVVSVKGRGGNKGGEALMKKAFIETNTVKLTWMSFMGLENWPSWELCYCRKSSLNFIVHTHKAFRTFSISSCKIHSLLSLFQCRLPVLSCLLLHFFLFQSTNSTSQLPLKSILCFPWVFNACFSFSSCSSGLHFCSYLFLTVKFSRHKCYLFNCLHLYSIR